MANEGVSADNNVKAIRVESALYDNKERWKEELFEKRDYALYQ